MFIDFIFTIFVVLKIIIMTGYEIREFIREETDGSKTYTYAMEMDGVFKTHNHKGAAIVNKEQKIKEYYSYGVNISKELWEKRRKLS